MGNLKYNIDMSEESKWEFITPGRLSKDNLLYMQEVGRFISGKNYFTQRDGLDSYLIKYTLSGKGILEYCGEVYHLEPGSFFFIDCTDPQKYYTDPAVGHWDVVWVHFNGATAKGYYEAFLGANQGKAAVKAADISCGDTLFELLKLGGSYLSESTGDITASALLTRLLCRCVLDAYGKESEPREPEYIARAVGYLKAEYSDDISLERLSDKINVSRFHLQREFTRYVGMSPTEYLRMIRLGRAKELLRGTDMPVTEVASGVGMDYSYFVQVFRKNEGTTPLQYRKSWSNR